MRIVLFTKLLTVGRFVDLALELADRGAEVVVATPAGERDRPVPEELLAASAVRLERYPEFEDDADRRALDLLRRARDYVWYLRPEHEVATFNRRRALDRLLRAASGRTLRGVDPGWADPPVPIDAAMVEHLEPLLAELEDELPPDAGVVRYLAGLEPDAILVTPVIRPGLHQTEVLKAARALGIPSGFPVYSWDSLSNKGRLHALPDRLYAWNDVHRREAVELHGVAEERVSVVGAPHWDRFFELEPSDDRGSFCARYGFEPDRPIVLYLGSTRTVCRDETEVVERWLAALRGGPPSLRAANVLVRPHPGEADAPRWTEWAPPGPGVARSAGTGKADQTLFDELFHADLAVGLNTSAQIEASIVGRPVYTFSAGDAAAGQEGSLHFYYLLEGQGGVVRYADSLDEHVWQLERGLAGEIDRDAIRAFCERIVRPRGLARPVVPLLADEVEALARSAPQAVAAARI
jgi:hypothetical protein